ncbi:hypothetical protein SDC9_136497 [bioreactor metagenome]|uniref:Uncharacterized protein n=1 Tax=bioreactor metagenome TaxID=1076179 RepID=A0A645DK06_9ZZZZ
MTGHRLFILVESDDAHAKSELGNVGYLPSDAAEPDDGKGLACYLLAADRFPPTLFHRLVVFHRSSHEGKQHADRMFGYRLIQCPRGVGNQNAQLLAQSDRNGIIPNAHTNQQGISFQIPIELLRKDFMADDKAHDTLLSLHCEHLLPCILGKHLCHLVRSIIDSLTSVVGMFLKIEHAHSPQRFFFRRIAEVSLAIVALYILDWETNIRTMTITSIKAKGLVMRGIKEPWETMSPLLRF